MLLAPLNYDRFFKKIFSDEKIAKRFLEDFLGIKIQEIEVLPVDQKLTNEASPLKFDYRCKVDGQYLIIDMQQWYKQDIIQLFHLHFPLASPQIIWQSQEILCFVDLLNC